MNFRKKPLSPVQFGSNEVVSVLPGFKLHCAVFDSISDHLHNLHLDPKHEVLIIEVGAGFGLLANVILPSISKEFPHINLRYTGIEIDSDRSTLISSSLEKWGNVRIINDDYKNFNVHIPRNVTIILLGTGLIQCLELEEIRCMLTLNGKSPKHFGVFTFPLNIVARGNVRIPPGNAGCAERSFTELTEDLQEITKSENFSDTTLQFLEVLEESNVLFSFNYSREKS